MARPLRIEYSGAVHHVTARRVGRKVLFEHDQERVGFLHLLERVRDRYGWQCLAYCLMGNHYHLVVRTPEPNLSRGMRDLQGAYAQAYNRRRDRPGPVWQGRFASRLVQQDAHLHATLRYVALNPVTALLVDRAEDWPWSTHAAMLGRRPCRILDRPRALAYFAENPRHALAAYSTLVDGDEGPVGASRGPGRAVYGDPIFTALAEAMVPLDMEVPREPPPGPRPTLAQLFSDDEHHRAALTAVRVHRYRQKEVAAHLGCHYSTVSRWVTAAERRRVASEGVRSRNGKT